MLAHIFFTDKSSAGSCIVHDIDTTYNTTFKHLLFCKRAEVCVNASCQNCVASNCIFMQTHINIYFLPFVISTSLLLEQDRPAYTQGKKHTNA